MIARLHTHSGVRFTSRARVRMFSPTWLAPEQVRILPIAAQTKYRENYLKQRSGI